MRCLVVFFLIQACFGRTAQAAEVPRLAEGRIGDLTWKNIFNMPQCAHAGHPTNVWCTIEDNPAAIAFNGVEAELLAMIRDPTVRTLWMATFTLGNRTIAKAVCDAAEDHDLRAKIVVDGTQIDSDTARLLATCSPNVTLLERGVPFEDEHSYLQHAKIVLTQAGDRVRFASTTSNMSSFGTGIHFDNWTFFETSVKNALAQQNLCFFEAIEKMTMGDSVGERLSFVKHYQACEQAITASPVPGVTFLVTPHANQIARADKELLNMLRGAKASIKVAMHRISAPSVYKLLARKAEEGVNVTILYDDDTLRTGKCDAKPYLAVNANEIQAYRTMKARGVKILFMESNGAAMENAIVPQLFHNKYAIVDDTFVFTGAGNFTGASLNTGRVGNFEQFYLYADPGIVDAYVRSWDYFLLLATAEEQHPVAGHKDKLLIDDPEAPGSGLLAFDESVCVAR